MNKLYLVGSGSGNYEDFTIKAINALNSSEVIFCDELMFDKIKCYLDVTKIISNEYTKTKNRCINAINSAKSGLTTSIIGSGDTGIYGISSIIFDEVDIQNIGIDIETIAGVTSAISGASLLGSPLTQDFALISLSDNLADEKLLQKKIEAVAKTNFVIVFYSPSNPTKQNLQIAKQILLKHRSPKTVIGIASHIGETSQSNTISTIETILLQDIDMFSTIFVGNSETHITKTKKMVTPLYKKTK